MTRLDPKIFAWNVLAAFLTLSVPLVIFLRHNGYGLVRPETLVIHGLNLGTALILGLVMTLGRTPGRVAVATLLAVLVVDVQTDWITTVGLRLLLNVVGWGLVAWVLRRRVDRILVVVSAAMLVGTLFTSAGPAVVRTGEPGPRVGDDRRLPFVLHVILDEQIGAAGIPPEFDPDGRYAALLREPYAGRGFRVFDRAYSRYASTFESVPNMVNGTALAEPGGYFGGKFHQGDVLERNAWFDLLTGRGYRLHVVQTKAFRLVDAAALDPAAGHTVHTYDTHDLAAFERVPLSVSQRVPFVLGTYTRLSYLMKQVAEGFHRVRDSAVGRLLRLPAWHLTGAGISPLGAMNAFDALLVDLEAKAGRGQAWVAHLIMPHYPYAFRADCSIEPDVGLWLEAQDRDLLPLRNTPESRALRYPLYLDQVACVQAKVRAMLDILDAKGLLAEAVILIHGDHGSRINLHEPIPEYEDRFTPEDFSDVFSTFFAVKAPVVAPGVDRRPLPLDHLFRRVLLEEREPGDRDLVADPRVFLQIRYEDIREVPFRPPARFLAAGDSGP